MNLPVEVMEAVRNKKCILFLGSHFAAEAADKANAVFPEPVELAKDLGWKKPKTPMGQKAKGVVPSVEEGCTIYEAANGRDALVGFLRERIGAQGTPPSRAHEIALEQFPLIFSTSIDTLLEDAAKAKGITLDVIDRNMKIPEPDPSRHVVVRVRGDLTRPDTLMLTQKDYQTRAFGPEQRKVIRSLVRGYVVFFVGYRPDEEEFERIFSELSDAYGGELPRCHLAVSQGNIDDYLWQKWVWRGLLMFLADPTEALGELEPK
jgi:hypothetical protein